MVKIAHRPFYESLGWGSFAYWYFFLYLPLIVKTSREPYIEKRKNSSGSGAGGGGEARMWKGCQMCVQDKPGSSLNLHSTSVTRNVKWLRWYAMCKGRRGVLCHDTCYDSALTGDMGHAADCQRCFFSRNSYPKASGAMKSSIWKIELALVTWFSPKCRGRPRSPLP